MIRFGPSPTPEKDYVEQIGVGTKQYPDFSTAEYLSSSDDEKRAIMEEISKDVFRWFLSEFEDTNFIRKAVANLGWTDV